MTLSDVCITIINQSGQETKSLQLIDEKGRFDIANLSSNSSTSFKFRSPGENVYHLLVVLLSGDTLKSQEEYIEGGYRRTAIISETDVTTKDSSSY